MTTEKSTYLRIALPIPLRRFFDYLPNESINCKTVTPGCRVKVPFGKRTLVGIFINFVETTDVTPAKLRPIVEILDETSLIPEDIYTLALWAADYYQHPVGEVLSHVLPVLLRQGKQLKKISYPALPTSNSTPLTLNEEQLAAVQAIHQQLDKFTVFLLHGVTGSGKTEVYLQAMASILTKGQQVLVLVPEIGLTPQTLQRFSERYSVMSLPLHSGLTERQRLNAWHLIKSGMAKIIIGTRSAVFSPFLNLGLIIIDEEHDLSFKQHDGFRYHARDLAIIRAKQLQIPIVLGTATPSIETLHKALSKKFHLLTLAKRAGEATYPHFKIIDIRNRNLEQGLSDALLTEIKQHLDQNNQVMLFLNRRGFAPVVLCHGCGWMVQCNRCDVRMTWHQYSKRLHCHHCSAEKRLPTVCGQCQSPSLLPVGLGTERLESVLSKHFPEVSIARIDRDSTKRKGSMDELLDGILKGEHQILIGTQMLAKGHHFPNVTLVGIVDADGGFFSSDFRAIERMGQLILQVAGRAGRVEKQGTVCIQTHYPDHPILHQLLTDNYHYFADSILNERLNSKFPPFSHLALLRGEAFKLEVVLQFLHQVRECLGTPAGMTILGPVLAPMPKRAGKHRAQLLLQSKSRNLLQSTLRRLVEDIEKISSKPKLRWSIDVDPMEMF